MNGRWVAVGLLAVHASTSRSTILPIVPPPFAAPKHMAAVRLTGQAGSEWTGEKRLTYGCVTFSLARLRLFRLLLTQDTRLSPRT